MQEVVRSFVLPGECDINHPHLTTPRVMLQIMGAPIAGRGTEKESGFDARESLTALPSWKARLSASPRVTSSGQAQAYRNCEPGYPNPAHVEQGR